MTHFVRSKYLLFSVKDIKHVCNECFTCTKPKPKFFASYKNTLIKATRPWERINVDFKGPVSGTKPYIFMVVDENSRFSFALPRKDQSATTITNCLVFGIFAARKFAVGKFAARKFAVGKLAARNFRRNLVQIGRLYPYNSLYSEK